jgi:hypothetical protein
MGGGGQTLTRRCCKCGVEIEGCMGFVKAGDLLDDAGNLILDYRNRSVLHELCGKCVERWQWNEQGELVPHELEDPVKS